MQFVFDVNNSVCYVVALIATSFQLDDVSGVMFDFAVT